MKTLAELKAFCEKNNVKYELNPMYGKEYYNPYAGEWRKPQIGWYFGMNNIAGKKGKSEWQWTWFQSTDDEATDESIFFFCERYSMLNGRSYTSGTEMLQAERIIERKMDC